MKHTWLIGLGLALLASAVVACGDSDEEDGSGGSTAGTGGGSSGTGGGSSGTGGGSSGTAGSSGTGGGSSGTGGGSSGAAGSSGTGGGSSGTGGGTGGGATGSCAEACANIASANCPEEDDEATCTADCEEAQTTITDCTSEISTFVGCVANGTITCDTDGFAEVAGCDAQETAYMSCVICAPATDDDACDTCEKTNCCDEMRAAYLDEDFEAYLDCAFACQDQACIEECASTYPAVAAAFAAAVECSDTNCAADCQ